MRNSTRKWLYILFLIPYFLACEPLVAQVSPPEGILLKEYLLELENRFDIRFSYREQDLGEVYVQRSESSDLPEILQFLEKNTILAFDVLNDRYIAVSYSPERIRFCGEIRDAVTGALLPGASLHTADMSVSTVTNGDGQFNFEHIKEGTQLVVRYLGYKTKEIIISENTIPPGCAEIRIEPSIFALQETVVVNYLTSGISKRRDGATYIDMHRFGTLPGQTEPDVLQTVAALPGVESVNETISNINIRGGTSDQNLVLFDGIKMYLTGHFFGLISAFNPNLVNDVLVVKNGTSPKLNDGVSGTIQIFSKDQVSDRISGGAGINMVSADAFLQIPVTDKLAFHFSGRRSINDILNTPTYDHYFSRTFQDSEISVSDTDEGFQQADFSYYDTSMKVLYDLNQKHKLRFTIMQITNDLNYSENNTTSQQIRRSSLAQNNLLLGGKWKASFSPEFSMESLAYLTHYRLNAQNYLVNNDQRLIQENEVLETGLKINATKMLSPAIHLLSGYQFYEVGVSNIEHLNNPFFSSSIKNVVRNHSVYSEIKYSGASTLVKGGVRINYLSKFNKFMIEPRFNLNQELSKDWAITLQGESKSQTTSQVIDLQEDFLGVENRRWVLADNETYPVITSKQVSFGLNYKSRGWYIDLEGFYKKVEGISTSNQGFQNQHEFVRTSGSYSSRGVELLVNKKWEGLHTFLTYTYGENTYTFSELTPSQFPNNFDIRHSLSLAANYSLRQFKFSIGTQIRSGRPYTRPEAGNETRYEGNNWVVNYAAPNEHVLPSFFRIDLSGSYDIQTGDSGNLRLGLGILNLLDRENVINRYFRVDRADPSQAIMVDNLSLGFTPNISLKYTF